MLWFDPTVEAVTQFSRDELDDESIVLVEERQRFESQRNAANFVRGPTRVDHHDNDHDDHHHDHDDDDDHDDDRCGHDDVGTLMAATSFAGTSRLVRSRRTTELTLVVMAGMITCAAYVIASLGANAVIPARVVPFLAIILGLVGAAHIAVRLLARGADGTLLPLVALLHGVGYVMITRLDQRLASLQTTWSLIAIGGLHRHAAVRPAGHRPGALQVDAVHRRRRAPAHADGPRPRLLGRRRQDLGEPRTDQLPARVSSPSCRSRSSSPGTSPSVAS